MIDLYYCTLHFDTSLLDFDLELRSQCEKANIPAPIISEKFKLIWMEFGIMLRLVGVMNLMLFLSPTFSIQGREPYLCDLTFKKNEYWFLVTHLLTDFVQTWYDDRDH